MRNQVRIAATAKALIREENAVRDAKEVYSAALNRYFDEHGRPEGRMTDDDPRFAGACRATVVEYGELQRLKRRFYRARQKLRMEVSRAGGGES